MKSIFSFSKPNNLKDKPRSLMSLWTTELKMELFWLQEIIYNICSIYSSRCGVRRWGTLTALWNGHSVPRTWLMIYIWRIVKYVTSKYDCSISGHATQNMLFWNIDYFEPLGLRKTANAGRNFLWTSLICLKTDPPKGAQLS